MSRIFVSETHRYYYETFAKVREKIPSKLIFTGDGPELVPMRQLTKELNVEEDVFRETSLCK